MFLFKPVSFFNVKFNEIKGEMNEKNKKVTESQKSIDDKLNKINITVIQQLDKLRRNIEFQKVSVCGGSNMTKINEEIIQFLSLIHI